MNLLQELSLLAEEEPAVTNQAPPKKVIDNVGFKRGLEVDMNKPLSQRDASNLIQKAEDTADEVDSVAFGLELNDGEVVKVYVNADQAEAFEKAMSELLGKEDDIEEAINELANEFDIISVEWPEQRGDQTNDQGQPEPVENDGDEENIDQPKESKIKLSFKLNKKKDADKEEGGDDKGDEKEGGDKKENDDLPDAEGEDLDSSDLEPKKDDNEEEPNPDDEGGDTEDDSEEDEEDTGDDKKKKPAKKKAKKKADDKAVIPKGLGESQGWMYSSFLPESKESKDEVKLEDIFRTALQRKIVKLIIHLDIPVSRLLQQKTVLRRGVREASQVLMSSSRGRQLVIKLLNEFDATGDMKAHADKEKELVGNHKKEELNESSASEQHKQISALVELLLKLLHHLGVPAMVLETRATTLKQHLRGMAHHILRHAKIRNYLHALYKVFEDDKKQDESLSEEVVLANDMYIKLVTHTLSLLGVPDENLIYRKAYLVKALREKEQTLNLPLIKNRLLALNKALTPTETQQTNEALTITEDAYRRRERAADYGEWNVAKVGEHCHLSIADIDIKLDKHYTDTLLHSLENGFEVTVKCSGQHYNFKPFNHGKEYAVIPLDDDTYADGILLPEDSVNAILELF